MKVNLKGVFSFLLLEAVLFSLLMPYVDTFNNIRVEGFRWALGYLFFFAGVMFASCFKKPALFFPVWAVCSAADFAFDKKSLLMLAPVSVLLWIFLNVIEPISAAELNEKAKKTKAIIANIAFALIVIAFFAATVVVAHKLIQSNYQLKYYYIPWVALFAYSLVSVALKSKFPSIEKLRRSIKKALI